MAGRQIFLLQNTEAGALMRNATLTMLLLGVAAGFLAGAWYNKQEPVGAAGLRARTVLYYVDPMHPAFKSDKPGIAPDCGMPLEPIYKDGGQPGQPEAPASRVAAGTIMISPEKQRLIGVRASTVEQSSAVERLRLYGRVAADETRSYRIDVGIDGFIREVSRVTTGSQVRKDQWLATFSAPEARSPIQAYLVALDVLDRTRRGAEGPVPTDAASAGVQQTIDRLLALGMSSTQIEDISETRQVPTNIRITAPSEGFVLARNVSTGQKFARGDELFRIADLRRVWILADVFGPEAEHVRPGTVAQVSVPGRTSSLRARVASDVLPQFDPVSQSVKVRLEADNPAHLLRPDMFVDVDLPITLPPAIAVPVDAVVDSGLKKTVFVERGDGMFEVRHVETGWRFGDRVQIVKGLTAGERIVVAGTFLLDSESRMRRAGAGIGSRH